LLLLAWAGWWHFGWRPTQARQERRVIPLELSQQIESPSEPPPVETALEVLPSSAPSAAVVASDPEGELERDPAAALRRARTARPSTEIEAQRLKMLEVRALVKLDRIAEARDETGNYYSRWPAGPDVALLQGLTGLHPTPSR
jgi:hypothetical protein